MYTWAAESVHGAQMGAIGPVDVIPALQSRTHAWIPFFFMWFGVEHISVVVHIHYYLIFFNLAIFLFTIFWVSFVRIS